MRNTHLIAGIALTAVATLSGCASGGGAPRSNIDYDRQRYEGTPFEKSTVETSAKVATFKMDIDSCDAAADRNYQESLANSAKLSQLYGQAVSPQILAKMKHLQVVVCMVGDKNSGNPGKGWSTVQKTPI